MLHLPNHGKYFYSLNEGFLKELISHSSDGIIFFNRDAIVVECNPAFELLSGFSRNEILQNRLREIFYFLDIDGERIIDKVLRGERAEIRNHSFVFREKSGNFDGCIIPLMNEGLFDGGVLIFSHTQHDRPTVSKQELYLSEQRFKLIAKTTDNAMYDWNFDSNELWFNEVFVNNYGFIEKDLTKGYEFWKNHIHPEDRVRVVNGLEEAISSGKESWKDEYRFLNKSGYYNFIMDRGYIIKNNEGAPVRMVGAMMEVSDVQRIEAKLKESQENYRFLAESMPQLVWVMNPEGHLLYANRKWTEFTGQEFDQYCDMGWAEVVHPDDFSRIIDSWREAFSLGCEHKSEHRLKSKYGEYRWFLTRSNPMRNDSGEILKWIGTSTDIHDEKVMLNYLEETRVVLKRLNQNLNSKNEQLVHINKELDNFVFAASHDLRSPVRNIESLLELLSSELQNHASFAVNNYMQLLIKSIHNLKVTIQDLTEVAKIEEGKDKEEIRIEDIIDDVLISIKDHLDKSKAKVKTDLKVEKLFFSPKNLRSILYNLILNSIKYRSPERNPVVKVKSYQENESTHVIIVEDNGIGIKNQDLPKVFMPFKRIHHQVEGSGMGMSIVKRIIDNNKGKIEIESEYGKGTCVKIYFPA